MPVFEEINGKTGIFALLGCPIEHTVSPQLHNSLSHMLGINAVYVPLKIERGRLGDAVRGLKACGFSGFNITIPYKEEVLEFVDETGEEVKAIGSANTIVNRNGRLYAYNTDGEGFARAFETFTGTGFKGRTAAIIGAGGTARALAVTLSYRGISKLYIINRTYQRALEIADLVNLKRPGTAVASNLSDLAPNKDGDIFTGGCDIIINATSLGMYPVIDKSPVEDSSFFKAGQIVCDIIYNPAKTKFLKQAEERGCRIMNGMGMLFYQGILAYEKWMDIKIPDDIINSLSTEFLKYLDK